MKTEVKFRELPEKVQKFIGRIFGLYDQFTVQLNWFHTLPEWKDATNEERMAYAEWRYPVGVVFKNPLPEHPFDIGQSSGKFMFTDNGIADEAVDGSCVYDNRSGKWAEIVSLPDIKEASPEVQQEFVKANPGMQHVEEFQAGEVVDVFWDHSEKWDCDGWRYLGIKNSTGSFVCEWEKTPEVQLFSKIRKIDPDRELKEIAKPIMEYWGFIEDGKCDPCILAALVDMGKKVKSKNK